MTPTIPPDVQQRHEREAKEYWDSLGLTENRVGAFPCISLLQLSRRIIDARIDAARSEYTRMAGEVERLKEQREKVWMDTTANMVVRDLYEHALRKVTEAESERDQLRAELGAARSVLDEWAPLEAGETKSLADRIRDEGHDFKMLCDHLKRTYCHFTNGRISKPNTLPEEVFAIAEDIAREETDERIRDLEAEVAAMRG